MLKRLVVRNFKVHHDTTLALSRVNILIGGAGTGKSSVIQALMILSQSAEREEVMLNGPWVKDVEFEELVSCGFPERPVEFGFDLIIGGSPQPFKASQSRVKYQIMFDNKGRLREQSARYAINDVELEFRTPKIGRWKVPDPIEPENRPIDVRRTG